VDEREVENGPDDEDSENALDKKADEFLSNHCEIGICPRRHARWLSR
jgi:hypothetical protein